MSCLVIGKAPPLKRCQFTWLAKAKLVHILRLYQVFIGHHITAIEVRDDHGFIHDMLDRYGSIFNHARYQRGYRDTGIMFDLIQVELDHLAAILIGWGGDMYSTIKSTWTQKRGIKRLRNIGRANGQYRLILNTAMV